MKAASRHKRAEIYTVLCDYTPQLHGIEFFLLLGNSLDVSYGPCHWSFVARKQLWSTCTSCKLLILANTAETGTKNGLV